MKKHIKFIIISLMTLPLFMGKIAAQQDAMFTKYMFNSLLFNPAYAGRNGYDAGSVGIHYRNQWVNLDGAPKTTLLTGEMSTFQNRLGIGLVMGNEQIGVSNRYDFVGNVCYRIEFEDSWLSGGLRAAWSQYKEDFSKLTIKDIGGGDIYDQNGLNYGLLGLGAGVYFHTEDFYAGFSVPSLAVVAYSDQDIGSRSPHVFLHTGMMLGDEYSTVRLEPSLMFKYQRAAPVQVTLGANIWLKDDVAFGLHYRSDDALALSAEFHFLEKFRIGAAYDFTLSELRRYSNNSFELLLGYYFQKETDNARIRNIRHGGRF